MRYLAALTAVVMLAAACSDAGVSPTSPDGLPTTIRASHTGVGDPATDDLCGGLSPCDAFDYDRDGDGDPLTPPEGTGVSGFCFLPPMVENHLSDAACSGAFVPGLEGQLQLAYCQVEYPTVDGELDGELDGSQPPTIVNCQDPVDWQDFTWDPTTEVYRAEVQFKKNVARGGETFRLYVVHNGVHFAHRDVIVDPNLTTPADGFLHSIGNGKEPVKLRVTEDAGCVFFATQDGGTTNAASCVIAGRTSVLLQGDDGLNATFTFPSGNPSFFADFELSECLPLGFGVDDSGAAPVVTGMPSVDTPLADCKISLTSEQLQSLTVPGTIELKITDARWLSGAFVDARLNVIQEDEAGQGVLPPVSDPLWFGDATSSSALFNLLGRGLNRVATFFGAKPLVAGGGAGFSFRRLSDFQVALMPVMDFNVAGGDCAMPAPHCLNLGTFDGTSPVPVSVNVTAPGASAGFTPFAVPGTRLHFFPLDGGTADCPSALPSGAQCYEPDGTGNTTDLSTQTADVPATVWSHEGTVFITGYDGTVPIEWNLGSGPNPHELKVLACGVARPGGNEPNPPGEPGSDGVWGTLADCSSRSLTATGFDNGPADGLTPYESVDIDNEVAIYGLPLTFQAEICPQITVDGVEGADEWVEGCAEITGFNAPLSGKKTSEDNAWLYTQNDETYLYVALKVNTNNLNDMFVNFVENFDGSGDGFPVDGDDLLLLRLKNALTATGDFEDWHLTQSCIDSQGKTLCGELDASQSDGMGAAADNGSFVFYEFRQPLNGGDSEDLSGGDMVGLQLQVTGGKGGGKGGFTYPAAFRTYHDFTIE